MMNRIGGGALCTEFFQHCRQTIISLILSGNNKVFDKLSTIIQMLWTDVNFTYIPEKPLCEIEEIKKMLKSITDDFRQMDYIIIEMYLPIMKQLVEKGNEMKAEQIVPLAKLGVHVGCE